MKRCIIFLIIAFISVNIPAQEINSSSNPDKKNNPSKITENPPASHAHTLVKVDSAIYLYGGYSSSQLNKSNKSVESINGEALGDLWQWEPAKKDWTRKTPVGDTPPARYGHSTAISRTGSHKFYVFFGASGDGGVYADIWSYDGVTNAWKQEPSTGQKPPGLIWHTTATLPDGRIMLFGGLNSNYDFITKYYIYDPADGSWESKSDFPGNPRYGSKIVRIGNELVVLPGYEMNQVSDKMYSYTNDTWQEITPDPSSPKPEPRAFYGAASTSDKIYIIGGEDNNEKESDEVWVFDVTSKIWSQLDNLSEPTTQTSAIVSDNDQGLPKELIVFGGKNNSISQDDTRIIPLSTSYTLKVNISPAEAQDNVSVTIEPNKTEYDEGESVKLTAVENLNQGWMFKEWSGDVSSTNKETSILMTGDSFDKTITANFEKTQSTNVENIEIIQKNYMLEQNYPNPFNPGTTIEYALPFNSMVKLEVYNILGQRVELLVNKLQKAGVKQKIWNAGRLASGVYFVRLVAQPIDGGKNYQSVRKMILLK